MSTTKFQLLVLKALLHLVNRRESEYSRIYQELQVGIDEIQADMKRGTKM